MSRLEPSTASIGCNELLLHNDITAQAGSCFTQHRTPAVAVAQQVAGDIPLFISSTLRNTMSSTGVSIPVFTSKEDMRAFSRSKKREGLKVALVPTMGYLHDGHLSLVKAAREAADIVVASIYVNPTQFSANEDFDVYPRNAAADRLKLQEAGCHAIFEPDSLYHQVPGAAGDTSNVVGRETEHPDAHETWVTVTRLQLPLCGGSRPHFFRGVATVVTKLFHIVEPDVAMFGQKDYQQWRVITRMVRDLDLAVEVVGMPICREADGLAMSSRNARLSEESRSKAPAIYQALQWAADAKAQGTVGAPAAVVAEIRQRLEAAGGTVDYIELRDAGNLQPVADAMEQPTLLAVAVLFPARDRGSVRLIDNIVL